MTIVEFFTLAAALLSAGFAARQAEVAEQSLDIAKNALDAANASTRAMAEFQHKHVVIQSNLEAFKASFTNDCETLIHLLNDKLVDIEEKIELGSLANGEAAEVWDQIKRASKAVKRMAGSCMQDGNISKEQFQSCFDGEAYDRLPRCFLEIDNSEVERRRELSNELAEAVQNFVMLLRGLSEAGRANIMSRLFAVEDQKNA